MNDPRPLALLAALAAVLLAGCATTRPPAPPVHPAPPPPASGPTPAPVPAPPRPSLTCSDPGEAVEEVVGAGPTLVVAVDRAVARVRVTRPELIQGDMLIGWPSNGQLQEAVFRAFGLALKDALAEWGYCVLVWQDAIAIQTVDGRWEEFHLVGHAEGRVHGAANTYKHTWRPTVPDVVPGPAPLPVVGCPLGKDDDHFIDFRFKATRAQNGLKVDVTPVYCGFPMPDATLFPKRGTKCVELGIDETGPFGEVCQRELVDPLTWTGPVRPTGNPYTVFLDGPSATVCASWKGCREVRP